MIIPVNIVIKFGEISVFNSGVIAPCHDWTEDYIAQGFCWQETQTAFLTLENKGILALTVRIEQEIEIRIDAIRAIQVPFFVPEDDDISIWPNQEISFTIPAGEYCLVYQTGLIPTALEEETELDKFTCEWVDMWCDLTFIRQNNAEAIILRQDKALSPSEKLYTKQRSTKPLIRRYVR